MADFIFDKDLDLLERMRLSIIDLRRHYETSLRAVLDSYALIGDVDRKSKPARPARCSPPC